MHCIKKKKKKKEKRVLSVPSYHSKRFHCKVLFAIKKNSWKPWKTRKQTTLPHAC